MFLLNSERNNFFVRFAENHVFKRLEVRPAHTGAPPPGHFEVLVGLKQQFRLTDFCTPSKKSAN